jgi:energy-coupling factor transport system permease protein
MRFALFSVPLAALFNVLTAHFGETVLFHLPTWLPFVGGAITLEALVYGVINGLVLSAFFAAFTVLNLAVPARDLIRLIPRAFYSLAVVVSIAVTFVPATLRQLEQVREAQAVRGRRMRGLRDWLPLFMPLLVGGLERALQLAEAMTARGFARAEGQGQTPHLQFSSVFALVCVLSGALLSAMWGKQLWGLVLLLAGIVVLIWTLWWAGKRTQHTTYRRTSWSRWDTIVLAGVITALLGMWLPARSMLAYTPYPTLTLPPFEPLVGIVLLGFTLPVFYSKRDLR